MSDETIEIKHSALEDGHRLAYEQGRAEALAEVAPRLVKLAALEAHAEAMAAALEDQVGFQFLSANDASKPLDAYRKWRAEQ